MRVTLILAATALSLVISACASGPVGAMPGHRRGVHHEGAGMHDAGMMMAMGPMVGCRGEVGAIDTRLASLHEALRINEAQEAVWTRYAEAYSRSASSTGMDVMGSMRPMSAMRVTPLPERLHHHEAMMSTHLASLRDLRTALDPLYAALSAEQKVIADAMACDRPPPARP
jgi:hypothetical protein